MVKPKITMYYDVVRYSRIPNRANESPYSFMGVEVLKRYRDFWGGRIEVDFVPFFLGGIMAGTGNRPPAFVPGIPLRTGFPKRVCSKISLYE